MNQHQCQEGARAHAVNSAHIVVPVEQHQQHRDRRREQQEAVLRERVGVEQATPVANADLVLHLLVVPIERREVDVRGRLIDARVLVVRAEDTGWGRRQWFGLGAATGRELTCG